MLSRQLATTVLTGLLLLPMAHAQTPTDRAANGAVTLAYSVTGREFGIPIIVIDGLGVGVRPDGEALTDALVAKGFRVVRFDNRDAGRSTALSKTGPPPDTATIIRALESRATPPVAYELSDMVEDTIAVLDAAGIERAHVMGHSLGAMIAQVLVAAHPERALSLISVSSSSGDPDLAFGPAMQAMAEPPAATAEERAAQRIRLYRAFEGKAYMMAEEEIVARVEADTAIDDEYAAGRQGAAATASGNRHALLRDIDVPALVIHGSADPLFPIAHARSTVDALPEASLAVVDGLGHILSDASAEAIATLVATFAEKGSAQ